MFAEDAGNTFRRLRMAEELMTRAPALPVWVSFDPPFAAKKTIMEGSGGEDRLVKKTLRMCDLPSWEQAFWRSLWVYPSTP